VSQAAARRYRPRFRIIPAVLFAAFAGELAAQRTPDLFEALLDPHLVLSPEQQSLMRHLRELPGALDVAAVRVRIELLHSPETLNVCPNPREEPVMMRGWPEEHGQGALTWHGASPVSGSRAVVVTGGSGVVATVWAPGRVYDVRPLGGGLHAAATWDPHGFPVERSEPMLEPPSRSWPLKAPAAGGSSECRQLSVLVAYTSLAAKLAGSIEGKIDSAIAAANDSYKASEVDVELVLAYRFETGYTEREQGSCERMVEDRDRLMSRDDPYMPEIHALRDVYAADVVVLLTGYRDRCYGLAAAVLAREDSAFAVVNQEYAAKTYGLAHEIGHLQGAQHLGDADMEAFPYGHGHCQKPYYLTVMTLGQECPDCLLGRVGQWSNPKVKFLELPTGTPDRDNARVLNSTACTLAGFRTAGTITASPTALRLGRGATEELTVTVTSLASSAAPAPVRVATRNASVAAVAEWTQAGADGRARIAVRGEARGSTVIEVRAEGASVTVPVRVPAASTWGLIAGGIAFFLLRRRGA
jgi:hypothetical protein